MIPLPFAPRARAQAAVAALEDAPGLDAIDAALVNCSAPEVVDVALPMLRKLLPARIALGAYANGFVSVHAPPVACGVCESCVCGSGACPTPLATGEYRTDLTPAAYAKRAEYWATEAGGGATIIGGCCGVFPEHIAAVSEQLHARIPSRA